MPRSFLRELKVVLGDDKVISEYAMIIVTSYIICTVKTQISDTFDDSILYREVKNRANPNKS